ncbi:hypothetical protein AMTR_s00039p00023470 [Amborella trichopoda]|uniref:Uncharacterized protein n=1 Tax=Amborella trichopoda TaxID=13333 RepID=U5D2S7_AMBTC|nr:hypothetical protein AMTR_s00039p00023470 [Amborella trichopoda]
MAMRELPTLVNPQNPSFITRPWMPEPWYEHRRPEEALRTSGKVKISGLVGGFEEKLSCFNGVVRGVGGDESGAEEGVLLVASGYEVRVELFEGGERRWRWEVRGETSCWVGRPVGIQCCRLSVCNLGTNPYEREKLFSGKLGHYPACPTVPINRGFCMGGGIQRWVTGERERDGLGGERTGERRVERGS